MADTFVPANRLDEADRVYPLICDLCPSCGQVQLRTVTSPAERYSDTTIRIPPPIRGLRKTIGLNMRARSARSLG